MPTDTTESLNLSAFYMISDTRRITQESDCRLVSNTITDITSGNYTLDITAPGSDVTASNFSNYIDVVFWKDDNDNGLEV